MAIPNIKNESEFEKVVNMAMKQVLDDTTINDKSRAVERLFKWKGY